MSDLEATGTELETQPAADNEPAAVPGTEEATNLSDILSASVAAAEARDPAAASPKPTADAAGAAPAAQAREAAAASPARRFSVPEGVEIPENLKVTFRAKDEDREMDLDTLVRWAQKGFGADDLREQRNESSRTAEQLKAQVEDLEPKATLLARALEDPAVWDALKDEYAKRKGEMAAAAGDKPEAAAAAAGPERNEAGYTQEQQAGLDFINQHMWSYFQALGEAYDVDPQELGNVFVTMVGEEPVEYLDQARIQELANEALLAEITGAGYSLVEGKTAPGPWAAPAPGRPSGRLRPKAAPAAGNGQMTKEELAAAAKALGMSVVEDEEAQQARLSGAPGSETRGSADAGPAAAALVDRQARSDAIDVTRATSLQDIQDELRKLN